MNACRHCGKQYAPPAWQVAKVDFECPPCRRERQASYRAQRKAEGRPSRHGQASPEYYKAWSSRPENKAKNATRARTRAAMRRGEILPAPCEICGVASVEAHHDDYSNHMAVRWFCREHHRAHHRKATGAIS